MRSMILAPILLAGLCSCGGSKTVGDPPPISGGSEESVSKYLTYMKQAYGELAGNNFDANRSAENTGQPIPVSAPNASTDTDFSATNVQIQGVDEADSLKFDGDILLALSANEIDTPTITTGPIVKTFSESVLEGNADEDPGLHLSLKENRMYDGMVSHNGYTAAIAWNQPWHRFDAILPFGCRGCTDYVYAPEVSASIWKYAESGAPLKPVAEEVTIDGDFVGARSIENKLYIVSRFYPRVTSLYGFDERQATLRTNQQVIDELSVEELVPYITINGEKHILVDDARCRIPESNPDKNLPTTVVSITEIDMTNPKNWKSNCVIGEVGDIFVSQKNVYLARDRWEDNQVEIAKYALTEDGPEYRASGKVTGSLGYDSYRFGEIDDKLTFVNTVYDKRGWWRFGNDRHQLSVLTEGNGELTLTAQIPSEQRPDPIGKPGEQIYAVRILGKRAYVVTFDKVDPLYVIDLSDTEDPKILGELEIPGFSSYLHPINENLIVGIGKNAKTENSTTWFQGLNVRLFDVSDPSKPKTITNLNYGLRGSQSAALYDPHAFTFVYNAGQQLFRFAVPMDIHEPEDGTSVEPDAPANTFYPLKSRALLQFEVNTGAEPNLKEVARYDVPTPSAYFFNYGEHRSVINGESIYYLHDNMVDVLDWGGTEVLRSFKE